MNFEFYKFIFAFLLFSFAIPLSATHNRAGEITYEQIGDLSIRVTITTYTKTSSTAADRDSLEIFWGDGTSQFIVRENGNGFPLPNDVKINYYIAEHTFPGRGTYTLSVMDPNRVASILNVNWPNSVNVPFYIETTFTFLNPQFQGYNNSAILLQAPIDFACAGQKFVHNPNAFDADGDSLSYSLVIPQQDRATPVPYYKFPDQIGPGSDNMAMIDEVTGNFIWDAPKLTGEYNIAIRINEFREGVLINSMIRDMQIFVRPCNNIPPKVNALDEFCVIAGETIEIDIEVTDEDLDQLVSLTASGGPFTFESNAARLNINSDYRSSPLKAKLIWDTHCDQISNQPYQVVLRGVDNFEDTTGLADLKTINIKVVGPPPESLEAESINGKIKLSWELPYECEFTSEEYFQGFSIWRKKGTNPFPIDTCQQGLEGKAYTKVIFLTNEHDGNRYFVFDEDVQKGITYCYRVLAEFARISNAGNPFNKVQSLASDEVCLQVSRDVPLITRVSIEQTSFDSGEILVEWAKPSLSDLDTLEFPGPYRYQLLRSTGINNSDFQPVENANFTSLYFNSPIDSLFSDTGLNTINNPYTYSVEFYAGNLTSPLGSSLPASSIFLNVSGSDRKNTLQWSYDVPWFNKESVIYRFNEQHNMFDSINITTEDFFADSGLENDRDYCYKVQVFGSYGIQDITDPLINYSQEVCSTPIDTVAPCPPQIMVSNICDDEDMNFGSGDLYNFIEWSTPIELCEGSDDVSGYRLYFSPFEDEELKLVAEFDNPLITEYEHQSSVGLSGCYAISSVDYKQNESELSNLICIDNCPLFNLPNTFTPNNDGANDLFTPSRNRFIEKIEMNIFSRWGEKVYDTMDPNINWDGKTSSGKDLPEGVYYYTCKVYELRVTGITQKDDILTGFIHLLR